VEHTRFFNQLPGLWRDYLKSTAGKERRTALMLLNDIVNDGNADISDTALQLAQLCGRSDAESVRQCYYNLTNGRDVPEPLDLGVGTPVLNYNPSLSPYDGLLARGVR